MSITINGKPYRVNDSSLSFIQFCEDINIVIPRFCYHDKLNIAGNCRMCLVELEGASKPVVACSTSLSNDMVFYVNNSYVRGMRESVLEFLLINHPLDCPICDQGGECDLQDQTIIFGSDRGRFFSKKRSVEDKYFGPLIKTIMTRCIHCTRCVRYFDEIVGSPLIGTIGRGNSTEISSYVQLDLLNEISGNVIDLCPVGALTSKPYAFTARPWELTSFESIDILDSFNSNIKVDVKGNVVMRILPKVNEYLNEEWITDFVRFSYDSFRKERLTFPMVKVLKNKNNLYEPCSWSSIYEKLKILFTGHGFDSIHVYMGESVNLYSSFMLKHWVDITSNVIYTFFDSFVDPNLKYNFLSKNCILKLSKYSNFFISNLDLKKNISILNMKIRRLKYKYTNNLNIYYVGKHTSFNYDYKHIGISNTILLSLVKGKNFFCNKLINLKINFLKNSDFCFNLDVIKKYNSNLDFSNITLKSESIHYNYLGIKNYNVLNNKYIDYSKNVIIYLVNYYKLLNLSLFDHYFMIYQGSHGSLNAMNSTIMLPSLTYMEETGMYINFEGKLQLSNKVIYNSGLGLSISVFLKNLINNLHDNAIFLIKANYDIFNNSIGFMKKMLNLSVNDYELDSYLNYGNYGNYYYVDSSNIVNYINNNKLITTSSNYFYFKKIFKTSFKY